GLASAGREGKAAAVEKSGPWQTAAALRDVTAWAAKSFHPDSNDVLEMRKAVTRPEFADLRMVQPLFKKLTLPDSGEGEDVLADGALAAFGASLLPDLRDGLDLKGGVADARRLRALSALVPKEGIVLCRQAIAEGSATMKPQAIRLLTRLAPAEAERAALEAVASKGRWELREAAFRALATSRDDRALDALLTALVDGDDPFGIVEDVLGRLPHPRATERLVEGMAQLRAAHAEASAAARAKKAAPRGKGKAPPSADEIGVRIGGVAGVLGKRKDAAAVPALVGLLDHKNVGVRECALGALADLGDLQGLRTAADRMSDAKVWESAARAAWRLPEPERYQRLAPWVEQLSRPKKSEHRRGKFVLDLFEEEFEDPDRDYDDPYDYWNPNAAGARAPRADWDPRWGPLLRKHLDGPYRPDAALGLAAVVGEKAVPELLPLLVPSVKKNECGVAEALGRLRAREAMPAMVELMPGQPDHHYCIHDALRRIDDPAVVPLLEALSHKTKDAYRRARITEVIEYLERPRAEA
ncbi:MAG TPA: HEAT repeat domain-containing protein, partial [Gemmataceae bacterium]|nr:HEAT repeat domain-containing protein [Gemmataceae bacterium]